MAEQGAEGTHSKASRPRDANNDGIRDDFEFPFEVIVFVKYETLNWLKILTFDCIIYSFGYSNSYFFHRIINSFPRI